MLRLLISKAGQSAQMAPVGAGAVTAIKLRQVPSDRGGDSGWQGCGTDLNPGLPMAGASLQHQAGFVSIGLHTTQHLGIAVIQVDKDVAGVVVLSKG